MAFKLPSLPYSNDALMPHLSPETLHYHYGKHHKAYVDNLNKEIAGTEYETMRLEEIIMRTEVGTIFNNAAQTWNHAFFWHCLSPQPTEPKGELLETLNSQFGSLKMFKEKFSEKAAKNFGSGWTWLAKVPEGNLEILNTSNAETPLADGHTPLLTCDVWEHAYYIDYRNERPKYIESFWKMANWDFAARCFKRPWEFA